MVGSDAVGGMANDGMEARMPVDKIKGELDDMDCCAATSDGRLRRANRFRERAVVDAMVTVFCFQIGRAHV